MPAYFQAAGKNWVGKIALNNTTRKTKLSGRYFKTPFGIWFGPGTLPTWRPRTEF